MRCSAGAYKHAGPSRKQECMETHLGFLLHQMLLQLANHSDPILFCVLFFSVPLSPSLVRFTREFCLLLAILQSESLQVPIVLLVA